MTPDLPDPAPKQKPPRSMNVLYFVVFAVIGINIALMIKVVIHSKPGQPPPTPAAATPAPSPSPVVIRDFFGGKAPPLAAFHTDPKSAALRNRMLELIKYRVTEYGTMRPFRNGPLFVPEPMTDGSGADAQP